MTQTVEEFWSDSVRNVTGPNTERERSSYYLFISEMYKLSNHAYLNNLVAR